MIKPHRMASIALFSWALWHAQVAVGQEPADGLCEDCPAAGANRAPLPASPPPLFTHAPNATPLDVMEPSHELVHRASTFGTSMTTMDGAFGKAHSFAALLALLVLAPMAEGAGIFLPVTSADAPSVAATSGMNHPVRDVVEPQMVRVAHAELARARDQAALSGAGSLLFNLPSVHLRGTIERTAPTFGGYSLSGRIDGPRGGFVTLAVHDEAVAGSIWTPEGSYEILPRGGGLHLVQPATAHQCEGAVADGDPLQSRLSPFPRSTGEVDDGLNTVVDILVVWTLDREEQAGGEAQVRAEIDSHVAYANDAFERSGAFIALNLVGAERVDYSEVDVYTDLERLRQPSDGHMDGVHDRRDALRADLVNLAVTRRFGLADLGGALSASGPSGYIFTHEIGHNFGLWHDRYDSHRRGHEYDVGLGIPGRRCIITIMATGLRCHQAGFDSGGGGVPYFSSPLRFHLTGIALGVSRFSGVRTIDGPADAVAALNRNRHAVAAFRR